MNNLKFDIYVSCAVLIFSSLICCTSSLGEQQQIENSFVALELKADKAVPFEESLNLTMLFVNKTKNPISLVISQKNFTEINMKTGIDNQTHKYGHIYGSRPDLPRPVILEPGGYRSLKLNYSPVYQWIPSCELRLVYHNFDKNIETKYKRNSSNWARVTRIPPLFRIIPKNHAKRFVQLRDYLRGTAQKDLDWDSILNLNFSERHALSILLELYWLPIKSGGFFSKDNAILLSKKAVLEIMTFCTFPYERPSNWLKYNL